MKLKKKGGDRAPFLAVLLTLVTYGHPPAGPDIVPLPLLNVQDTLVQLVCVAVNKNVLLPTADVTLTPVVGLKPGAVEFVHALPAVL